MVESIARVKHIRVTPQKARRVVALIKGKQAQAVSYTHLTLPTSDLV